MNKIPKMPKRSRQFKLWAEALFRRNGIDNPDELLAPLHPFLGMARPSHLSLLAGFSPPASHRWHQQA